MRKFKQVLVVIIGGVFLLGAVPMISPFVDDAEAARKNKGNCRIPPVNT